MMDIMNGQRLGLTTYYRTISVDNKPTTVIIGPNGEPLKLPESLESLPKSDHFPSQRHRWNTNEEIASMLIAFDRHQDWLSKEVKIRPKSGSMLLYSRKKVRYRRDGYCWKKRKDGKTTREDHMKLKVQGMECIYGCYVHSAILPTFHRRCYWLLQNPDIVLVHYLNVPYPDDNKMVIASSISLWGDKKEWTKEELISQLKPMFFSEEEPDLNNELEISTAETVEAIVVQLMEKQRAARTAALNKQLECGCPDSLAGADRTCPHHGPSPNVPRRVRATKSEAHTTTAGGNGGRHRVKRMLPYLHENNNQFYKTNERYYPQGSSCPQVSSTTGNHLGMMTPERGSSETPTPQPHQMGHHPPPLVLSLSQLQQGGGLLIVNSAVGNDGGGHRSPVTSLNGLTPLVLPATPHTPTDPNGHLLHSSGRSDSSASSNSPIDLNGGTSTTSPVSSAVRSLASLSDFSLDINNGNFDTYSGVQSVTDTMLSGHESSKQDGPKHNNDVHHGHHAHHHQAAHQQHHRGPVGSGPLLDFRSAFSDFEGKSGDLGFFDLNSHEEMQRHMKHSEVTNGLGHGQQQGGGHHHGHHQHHSHQHHPHSASIDLNPMDFIDHDVSAHPIIPSFDLDPFDMLGEFSELDQYGGGSVDGHGHPPPSSVSSGSSLMANLTSSMAMIHQNLPGPMLSAASSPVKSVGELHHNHNHNQQRAPQLISDYSPEWSWSDGETKVLVTGPWKSGNSYQVLIDGQPVTTTLVQDGVLRCMCPAHDAGIVSLQVSLDGDVISDAVIFEYKKKDADEDDDASLIWECGNVCNSYLCETETCRRVLRTKLLERIESLEAKLSEHDLRPNTQEQKIPNRDHLEEYLTSICDHLSRRPWKQVLPDDGGLGGPTLLHLAATLNLVELTKLLLRWAETNSSPIIEKEINGLSQDEEGFTPLMRACSGNFNELALLLCQHNPKALRIRNFYGETSFDLAARSSNSQLVETLEAFDEGSAGFFGGKGKGKSPAKKTNEFAKPTSLALSSLKFRAKSVDNTDHLLTSSPKSGPRFKMKFLSTSPSRMTSSQSQSGEGSSSCYPQTARRRLSKRPSLDSGIHLIRIGQNDGSQFFNSSHSNHQSVESEPRKPSRAEFLLKTSDGPVMNISTKSSFRETRDDDPDSPFIDVEALSDEDVEPTTTKSQNKHQENPQPSTSHATCDRDAKLNEDQKVLTLAEQFIAAMPARIKNESDPEAMHLDGSSPLPFDASQSDDLGIESMADELDLEFDFSLEETRSYRDTYTPSSLSPGSSYLPSPISFTMESPSPGGPRSFSAESGSPPCTTADLQEFLQASMKCERALSKLTLSDQEQRELYEAAQIIQKAYRSYKGRKKADDQQGREAKAAIVIQNYYRRYKEYLYWKQMAKAATVIQNQYRTYCEHKRFKKSQEAATCIQNYYRTYKEHKGNSRSSRESTPSTGLKRTYSQRRQHQAAKKIQQFMRKSHLKPLNEFLTPCRKGMCVTHRCSVRLVMAEKVDSGRALNQSLSFSCCSPGPGGCFFRQPSFSDFFDAAERAGSIGAPPPTGCYTCSSVTGHTNTNTSTISRKREAGPTGSGVPAKLSGFSDANGAGASVIHSGHQGGGGNGGSHLHHHHHHHQQQAFSNGYHPHPHHHHHHHGAPPGHLRPNGSQFYGWHTPSGNTNTNNSPGPQHSIHQQLPPPPIMAIANK